MAFVELNTLAEDQLFCKAYLCVLNKIYLDKIVGIWLIIRFMSKIIQEHTLYEKNFPAEQYIQKKNTRFPGTDVHQKRTARH